MKDSKRARLQTPGLFTLSLHFFCWLFPGPEHPANSLHTEMRIINSITYCSLHVHISTIIHFIWAIILLNWRHDVHAKEADTASQYS